MADRFVELPVAHKGQATFGYKCNGQWTHVRDVVVESDGGVLAYDDIAGHYTRCHDLTEPEIEQARRLASVAQ